MTKYGLITREKVRKLVRGRKRGIVNIRCINYLKNKGIL